MADPKRKPYRIKVFASGKCLVDDLSSTAQVLAWAEDEAWILEAERRYQELKSGQVEAVSDDDVFESIRSELRQ